MGYASELLLNFHCLAWVFRVPGYSGHASFLESFSPYTAVNHTYLGPSSFQHGEHHRRSAQPDGPSQPYRSNRRAREPTNGSDGCGSGQQQRLLHALNGANNILYVRGFRASISPTYLCPRQQFLETECSILKVGNRTGSRAVRCHTAVLSVRLTLHVVSISAEYGAAPIFVDI